MRHDDKIARMGYKGIAIALSSGVNGCRREQDLRGVFGATTAANARKRANTCIARFKCMLHAPVGRWQRRGPDVRQPRTL